MPQWSSSSDPTLGELIARVIRDVRTAFGWSQRELARRLGTNQSAIARLESPATALLNLALADAAFKLLGIRPVFDTNLPGLAHRSLQRDAVHARCCAYVGTRLRAQGWDVRHEVEIGTGRGRGWIDVLAYRPGDRALLVVEVKTELVDVGSALRTVGWHERGSWQPARALGWAPRRVTSALLVLSTTDNDARLRTNGDLLRQALPGSARELAAWVAQPDAGLPARSLASIDPRSRRRESLRPTPLDGRRSPAPYLGYAHAAATLAGGRSPR